MRLLHLAISNFRNMASLRVEPGERYNLLHGLNGHGKTNLLEAIYLLGSPRSFRTSRLPELIKHGERCSQVQGVVESAGTRSKISVLLETAGRRVDIDGKGVHKASELHGRLNAVIFSPDDTGMVKWVRKREDVIWTGLSIPVISAICIAGTTTIAYLKQRNHLLKCSDKTGLDIWTEKLAEAGSEVIERRQKFVAVLDGKLRKHYATISDHNETSGVSYHPDGVQSCERETIRLELLELLKRHQSSDERYGTTTAGPHRDDLTFMLDERQLKAFGSQGQQKSFVLALKMAEMDNLHDIFGESPLLLLDDMSSELDFRRNRNLMEFLTSRDIQVFVTTTERSPALLDTASHCAVFRMEGGNLTSEGK